MPTLIVLIGPTGVGKTELSLRLAETFQTSIVSADSRQLYAELKIGTAAPTPDQLKRVPHQLVGTLLHRDNLFVCYLYKDTVSRRLRSYYHHFSSNSLTNKLLFIAHKLLFAEQ